MSKIASLTLAAALFTGTAAFAQTVLITPQQETVIRDYVVTQEVQPVQPPANVLVEVGSTVPDTVELYPVQAPDLDVQYEYVVIDGQTVLVEPASREIVHIVR